MIHLVAYKFIYGPSNSALRVYPDTMLLINIFRSLFTFSDRVKVGSILFFKGSYVLSFLSQNISSFLYLTAQGSTNRIDLLKSKKFYNSSLIFLVT